MKASKHLLNTTPVERHSHNESTELFKKFLIYLYRQQEENFRLINKQTLRSFSQSHLLACLLETQMSQIFASLKTFVLVYGEEIYFRESARQKLASCAFARLKLSYCLFISCEFIDSGRLEEQVMWMKNVKNSLREVKMQEL